MADLFATRDAEFTDDVFLGGKVVVRQPIRGYRAGVDPVLLAAAAPQTFAGHGLDVGAGAGTVGLCIAARCPAARMTLVERAPELVAFAAHSIGANDFDGRVSIVEADVVQPADVVALPADSFDLVVANPPYHEIGGGTPAETVLKAASNAMARDALDAWVRFITRMARAGGRAFIIHKADALPRLLQALDRRFGALRVLPIQPRASEPANRVLIAGIKGSRAPMTLLPAFVLHTDDGAFTTAAKAILRDGAPLEIL